MNDFLKLLFSLALPLAAQSVGADNDKDAIVEIITAVEHGWENADGTPFREHFLDTPGARYFESGGQNVGLDDLVENHVEPEGDALADFELDFFDPEIHVEGGMAWALFDTEIRATVRATDRALHNRGRATFIFRRVDGAWKVVHTHSSSRPVAAEPTDDNGHDHGGNH